MLAHWEFPKVNLKRRVLASKPNANISKKWANRVLLDDEKEKKLVSNKLLFGSRQNSILMVILIPKSQMQVNLIFKL